mgnify:FL=1
MLSNSCFPLPDPMMDQIEEIVTSQTFPWYLLKETTFADEQATPYAGVYDNNSFSHVLVMNYEVVSHQYDLFESALRLIAHHAKQPFTDIYRVRLGCLLPDNLPHHCPHVDFEEPHTTALYYVNKSDGDTFFFPDEDKYVNKVNIHIPPERGKMIVFDGLRRHASSSPSKGYRIALNINFKPRVS